MITVRLVMKLNQAPLKRVPVALRLDALDLTTEPIPTDRSGVARFDLPPGTGKVLVERVERYQGRLEGEILIALWSPTEGSEDADGPPGGQIAGSTAYSDMQTRVVLVEGRGILTDSEGYLVDPADWSEGFARALAQSEGLTLADAHWEVIRFLRGHFAAKGFQASVRDMVQHFRRAWDAERGRNRQLHQLFPRGGPQKQGNRLAGLLRTKGEH
jgi:tRNA 2-thiouridine synthesizing protein E